MTKLNDSSIITADDDIAQVENSLDWEYNSFFSWIGWNKQCVSYIKTLEDQIFSNVEAFCEGFYVKIRSCMQLDDTCYIWTRRFTRTRRDHETADEDQVPIVLVHGYASGMALWCLNIDDLCANGRTVFTIDLIGFGRSSRPSFGTDVDTVERQFVKCIELWRKAMDINSMYLLGHSLGGYIVTSYALAHPRKLDHLILVDPWGFADPSSLLPRSKPFWFRAPVRQLIDVFSPLSVVRMSGPFAWRLISLARADMISKYKSVEEAANGKSLIGQYIHYCNIRKPSGEEAFKHLSTEFGWAKRPMITRVRRIDVNLPITCIYGSRSWIDCCSQEIIKERPFSYVDSETICGASHHVYADQPESFSAIVTGAYQFPKQRWIDERNDRYAFSKHPINNHLRVAN